MTEQKDLFDSRKVILRNKIAASTLFFLNGFVVSNWAGRIPAIKEKFDLNAEGLGLLLLFPPIGSLIGLPLAAWLSEKFGSKKVIIYSSLTYCILLTFISFPSFEMVLAVTLVVFGIAGNCLNVSMNTLGVEIEKVQKKPILSTFHAIFSIGGLLGSGLCAFFVSNSIALRTHYLIISGISVLLILICVIPFVTGGKYSVQKAIVFTKPSKSILLLGIISCFILFNEGAVSDWSSVYFKGQFPKQFGLQTTGYTAFFFSMAIGRLLGDFLKRNIGPLNLLKNSMLMSMIGIVIATIFTNSIIWAVGGFILMGLGFACVIPIVYSLAGNDGSMKPSVAIASVSTIGFIGIFIGPPVVGFVAQSISLRLALLTTILGTLLVVMFLIYKIAHLIGSKPASS